MIKTVLMIGGTGGLGAPVARQLRSDGYQVRLLVRDRSGRSLDSGFDHVVGDLDDPASLRSALAGCDAVHVSARGGPRAEEYDRVEHLGTARVAQLAADAGVERLTYVSHMLAAPDGAAPDLRAKFHASRRSRVAACPTQSSGRRTSWRPCHDTYAALAPWSSADSPSHST
jgi:uncharacterized protein YbjT (DUF2867 family)